LLDSLLQEKQQLTSPRKLDGLYTVAVQGVVNCPQASAVHSAVSSADQLCSAQWFRMRRRPP